MARISGIELSDNWRIDYALTKIKGIGWSLSGRILGLAKIDVSRRVKDIKTEELNSITEKIAEYPTEGDLLRNTKSNIARLQTIGSYRGTRHSKGLPARGQRTRTNARTKRGKRKTVGAFKKEVLAKQSVAKKG